MQQLYDGEWTRPVRKGYVMECCHCGLCHRVDFRIVRVGRQRAIEFRATRIPRGRKKSS